MNGIVIEDWFRRIIDIAREFLEQQESKDHISPVNLYHPLPDFWDEWFDPVLEAWNPDVRRNLREFFLSEMQLHPAEVLPRYVALAVYDGLIQYLTSPNWEERRLSPAHLGSSTLTATGKLIVHAVAPSWHDVVDELKQDCLAVLRSVAPSKLTTWRDIEWEISNSCLMEDWDRARQLYERARELNALDEGVLLLLRAQFEFLLAWRDSSAGPLQSDILEQNRTFLRNRQLPYHPCNWEPKLYDLADSFSSLLFFAGALDNLIISGAAPHPQAVRESVDALERAKAYLPLPTPYQALLGRYYFGAGRFDEAAAEFEKVLKSSLRGAWRRLRPYVYLALSDSYLLAKEPTKAINVLKSCSLEFPEEANIYIRTAKIQGDITDYQGARETIRTGANKAPGFDTDWRYSTMLALGEVQPHSSVDFSAIKMDQEIRDNLESFLEEYWPPFVGLSPQARQKWTRGAHLSHFFLKDKSMLTASVHESHFHFAVAVEIEFREKVFLPVRNHFREREELYALVRELKSKESKNNELIHFCEFVMCPDRKVVLGFCEKVLGFCKQRNTPIIVALREWVEYRFPRLLPSADLLKPIVKFRNDYTHGNDSILTVDDLPERCRKLIETLHEQRPAPSSA